MVVTNVSVSTRRTRIIFRSHSQISFALIYLRLTGGNFVAFRNRQVGVEEPLPMRAGSTRVVKGNPDSLAVARCAGSIPPIGSLFDVL